MYNHVCVYIIYNYIYTHTCKCGARRIATEPRNTDKNQESLNILADFLLFSPRNRETKLLGVSCWCCHCWDLLRTVSIYLDVSPCVSMCLNINVSLELWSSLQRREFSRSLNCEDEFPSRRLDTSWHVQMPFYLEARKMANTQCLMAGDSVPTASLRRMQLSELVWQILYGEKQLLTNSEVKKEVSIFRYNWYNWYIYILIWYFIDTIINQWIICL